MGVLGNKDTQDRKEAQLAHSHYWNIKKKKNTQESLVNVNHYTEEE